MSDDWEDSPWAEHYREVDEEIARQHSRELNEQIGREHSAELDKQRAASDPWPPEGTRVRIVGTFKDGNTGCLIDRGQPRTSRVRWIKLDRGGDYWPVERHEIEVIDE